MTKIIFVCFGNICRSPMAEFVMKYLVVEAGLEENFLIESAGCHPSVGTPMSNGTAHELKKNKIPFTRRTSKLLLDSDYKKFDYLIGLDRSNVRDMKENFGGDPDKKIFLLMEFAGERRDVDDPWYTDDYAASYRDILIGCEALLEHVKRAENFL
ncbi:MAG: low molecular weight phosphotyrosine protein phosphatase [Quinella sp. 3Q1]|nr:low molecular weight phosphotyrosine protein phosphatase [Quinella sp. 3Q1]MBR3050322.1 low molecular weight phosphotyrosine protein phosphatase [Selenomonadaceae bacterium]